METLDMSTHLKRPLGWLAISPVVAACAALLWYGAALADKPDRPGKPDGDDEISYLVTDLPGFDHGGSSQSQAFAVSNPDADENVLVVGKSWLFDPTHPTGVAERAVMWKVSATGDVLAMMDLGYLPGDTEGRWRESIALAVNDVGMAVGWSTIDSPVWTTRAVVFMPDGSIIDLGTLGGTSSGAKAINNPVNGVTQVIGGAGAYWEVDILGNVFGPIDLTAAGDFSLGGSEAGAINNSGVMAGVSQGIAALACFDDDGTLWTNQLGTLGGTSSRANSVDDFGNAAGRSETASGEHHAFLWQEGNGMTDLGTLGGPGSFARGINVVNGSIQVVGESETANLAGRAVLWENGAITELNALIPGKPKWSLSQACAVNQAGQIVGLGRIGGRRGEYHGYLLMPNSR
jgi:probable HAF family extracellular repeat protein